MFCCIRILSKKLSLQIRVTLRALLQWFRFSFDALTSETLNNTRIRSPSGLCEFHHSYSYASRTENSNRSRRKEQSKVLKKRCCQTRFSLFPKSDIHITERSSSLSSSLCLLPGKIIVHFAAGWRSLRETKKREFRRQRRRETRSKRDKNEVNDAKTLKIV